MFKPLSRRASEIAVGLSALVAMLIAARLGIWQLDRAEQKVQWSRAYHHQSLQTWRGVWLRKQTLYWDNRQMQGLQGFFVFTPLLLSSDQYLLVQRGFIPRDFQDRKKLQPVDTPSDLVEITGRPLTSLEHTSFFMDGRLDEYPIVQSIDPQALTKRLAFEHPQIKLVGIVRQEGSTSEGLMRRWYEPQADTTKHYGYALQWFGLSTLVCVLYGWKLCRKKSEKASVQ